VTAAVATALTLASGAWIAADHRSAVAWIAAVAFGACASFAGWQFYDARPRLVIDDRGVLDRTFAIGVIPWRDIRGVELKRIHGHPHLCLTLDSAAAYTTRLSPMLQRVVALDRQMGFTDLCVSLAGSPVDADQIVTSVRQHISSRT
jgi:hypothetical protein